MMQLITNLIDIEHKKICPAQVRIESGYIREILPLDTQTAQPTTYMLMGFVDAHVHIESSMVVPSEFARLAVVHGSVGTVSDPHEIANVLGVAGVDFMIKNGQKTPFGFNFGAPSCVPATSFETAGARIDAKEIQALLERPEVKYLAEMMNFPGVIYKDPEVMEKIAIAHRLGKPVDGHAPLLRGEGLKSYQSAGISTDHESVSYEEGLEKIQLGMHLLIREGSAAKNFEALIPLLDAYPEQVMFCSDDMHPDNLLVGHLNLLVKRALAKGIDLFKVLRAACLNPILHYKLDLGRLRVGDSADFILIDAPTADRFNILQTYIKGELVAENGRSLLHSQPVEILNNFGINAISPESLQTSEEVIQSAFLKVISVRDGQLITDALTVPNQPQADLAKADILKLVVINRYKPAQIASAYIHNVGLKNGAIGSCVAHDSHNIIVVGSSDELICRAANLIIAQKGGISAVSETESQVIPLPIAGIMSDADVYEVADAYTRIDAFAKSLGSSLRSPFMSLSFMALLVIPKLKLSDLGLFDGEKFAFTPVGMDTKE